jgi:hypothetical protein
MNRYRCGDSIVPIFLHHGTSGPCGVAYTRIKLKIEKSVFLDRSASGHRTFSIPHITSGHYHIARDHSPTRIRIQQGTRDARTNPRRHGNYKHRTDDQPRRPVSVADAATSARAALSTSYHERRPPLASSHSSPHAIANAAWTSMPTARSPPIRSSVHRPHVHVKPAALLASTASSPWVLYSNQRVSTNS